MQSRSGSGLLYIEEFRCRVDRRRDFENVVAGQTAGVSVKLNSPQGAHPTDRVPRLGSLIRAFSAAINGRSGNMNC